MSCALCGGEAAETIDARMPLLRIPSCSRCRDRLAYTLGWTRAWRCFSRNGIRLRVWNRRDDIVEVIA